MSRLTPDRPAEGIRVRNRLPGRLRLQVSALFRQDDLAGFLSRELSALPDVVLVRAQARTGSLLVCYRPRNRAVDPLLQAVERTVEAWRQPGFRTPGERPPRPDILPVLELLAGVTAGLSWYWGQGLLGLGLLSLAGLSLFLRRGGTVPRVVEHKTMLMAGLAAAGTAAVHLAGGQRTRVLAGLIAGNPLATGAAVVATCEAARARLVARGVFTADTATLIKAADVDTLVFTAASHLAPWQGKITDVLPVDRDYSREDVLQLLEDAHRTGSPEGGTDPWNLNLRTQTGGRSVHIGTAAYLEGARIALEPVNHQVRRVTLTGGIPLFMAVDGAVVAIIGVEQKISPQLWRDLQGLLSLGLQHLAILAGDGALWLNPLTAGSAFDLVAGGLSPAAKAEHIGELQRLGRRVAVVGYLPEDGPALARADLAIALDSLVSTLRDPARLTGTGKGLVVMGRPGVGQSLQELFIQGKQLREACLQNFITTVGGNLAGLGLAAFGWLGPGWAFAFEAYTLAASAYRRHRIQVHPLTRAEVGATAPPVIVPATVNYGPGGPAIRQPLSRAGHGPIAPGRPALDPREGYPALGARNWHSLTPAQALAALDVDDRAGLTAAVARERLARYGYNELPPPRPRPWWELLRAQSADFMVQLLLGVSGISVLAGRTADALTIVAIVLANAGIGVFQEMRAAKSLAGLTQLTPGRARVWREGREMDLAARELVPGDLVLLAAGDLAPADLRILQAHNLSAEESSLTGETLPVPKNAAPVPCRAPLTERAGMIYAGSCVVRGRGLGVVIATGPATEMGDIARSLGDERRGPTTLQRSMGELGRNMAYGCLGISALVFGLGLVHRQGIFNMFVTALSLLVSAIPEDLMPMVTIGLAMAVFRMSRRAMVVRRLTAIETLGCVSTICVDKTGTLTKNEMTVREVYAGDRRWLVTGEGYDPRGGFSLREGSPDGPAQTDLNQLLLAAVLCNNARLRRGRREKGAARDGWSIQGDPTEGALLVAAAKAGPGDRGAGLTRVAEAPFEAEDRQMAVVYETAEGRRTLFVKGAPDRVLQRCALHRRDGTTVNLDAAARDVINGVNEEMAAALRVLALAYKPLEAGEDWRSAGGLVFAGLAGMQDPPRPGVRDALRLCRRAGVAVMMITGDHPSTARAVARAIGLLDGGLVLTGDEVDALDDPDLDAVIKEIRVCARALPRHKLRLVKSLQRMRHVVAMAGDGVNDAPAVRQADIGLAMGLTGTDLTKGVSDMSISDDDFTTIVRGIEEGRAVYENIRHAVGYLLYTNAGDVVLMLAASFLGLPMPLVPIQLLWINLSGDGLPALAIMADPPAAVQMARPPRPRNESLLAHGLGRRIVTRGVAIGLTGFATYWWGLTRYGLPVARTMAVGSLGLSQFFHLFDRTIEGDSRAPNLYKVGAGLSGLALILASIYVPALRGIFQTTPLGPRHWLPVLLGAGALPLAHRAAGQLTAGSTSGSPNRRIIPHSVPTRPGRPPLPAGDPSGAGI